MEDKKPWPDLALKQNFAKGRVLELKVKTSDLRYALSKLELLKRITDWSLGAESPAAGGYEGLREKPPAAERFFVILWKKNTIDWHLITFCTCSEKFESTRFLTFQSQLKKLNCSILLLLAI